MLHDGEMSHISDMHLMSLSDVTTLRGSAACMVLIAPAGTSHAFGMLYYNLSFLRNLNKPQLASAVGVLLNVGADTAVRQNRQ